MGGSHHVRRSGAPVVAVLTALVGHWIANLLLDRDEYARATARVLEHLHIPALVQTVVGGVAVLALILWTRRRRARGDAQLLTGLGQQRHAPRLRAGVKLVTREESSRD